MGANFTVTIDTLLTFGPEEIVSAQEVRSCSVDGLQMQADELYLQIRVRHDTCGGSLAPEPCDASLTIAALGRVWNQRLSSVPYGTPVWIWKTDTARNPVESSIRKYYWKCLERNQEGPAVFSLTAQSDIGVLDGISSDGGLFHGETLGSVLHQLLYRGGIVPLVPYTVDSALSAIPVYGWLPAVDGGRRQTVRDHIHALMFALGFALRRDENRCLWFTTLPPVSSEKYIPPRSIFLGMSAPTGQGVSRVEVLEYQYVQDSSVESVVLFDNTQESGPANGEKVFFSQAPVFDVVVVSGDITFSADTLQIGANLGVVSGTGTITGKPYRVFSRAVGADAAQSPLVENVQSVSGVYTVNPLNAQGVADRLRDTLCGGTLVDLDMVRDGENPGDFISFTDIYGDSRCGYLTSMSTVVTSFERARCQVLCGYVPSGAGNRYNAVFLIAENGTFTVPEELDGTEALAVLIGGGSGGSSGVHGKDDGGNGCGKGSPGAGGRIQRVTLTLTAGETYSCSIGAGGSGGIPSNAVDAETGGYLSSPGTAGGHTTLSGASSAVSASSADGSPSALGYTDILTGTRYGSSGPDNGQPGGEPQTERNSPLVLNAFQSDGVSPGTPYWTAGQSGQSLSAPIQYWPEDGMTYEDVREKNITASGGFGGGAAFGSSGGTGGNAAYGTGFAIGIRGGDGGDGADAVTAFPPNDSASGFRTFGWGGSGGHGGGAAGSPGSGSASWDDGNTWNAYPGNPGTGGSGSPGQDGMPGCILLYTAEEVSPACFAAEE